MFISFRHQNLTVKSDLQIIVHATEAMSSKERKTNKGPFSKSFSRSEKLSSRKLSRKITFLHFLNCSRKNLRETFILNGPYVSAHHVRFAHASCEQFKRVVMHLKVMPVDNAQFSKSYGLGKKCPLFLRHVFVKENLARKQNRT